MQGMSGNNNNNANSNNDNYNDNNNDNYTNINNIHNNNLSSPKPGHTTGGSGRRSAQRTVGRGEAGQTKVPTFRSAPKAAVPLALQGTVNNCTERLYASTNKGNPM